MEKSLLTGLADLVKKDRPFKKTSVMVSEDRLSVITFEPDDIP
jgi:hypothetical protein